MYPMDFEEYLWAVGDMVTYDAIKNAYEKRKPLGDAIHRKIMKTFRTYMVVGGMPQAVSAFVEGKTFAQIDFIKRNILHLYEEDLAKYEIDFITVKNKKICPIEVKSSGYTSHKSIDYLVEKYQMKMQDRFIIYTKDLKYQDGILYVPIYMTMCI